jgi:flagellar hook-length control protein FliK
MTAAQKSAKEKFKKAIAYRTKTGVSLKEAFAHIYGKKVGAVKKKTVVKKAAPKKKTAVKKAAPKKKTTVKKVTSITKVSGVKKSAKKKISEKAILNKIHTVKKNVERLDEAQHSHMMGRIVKNMIKKYVVIYNLPGKVSMVEFVTATSLPEAKKIALAFKKHNKIKGTTKVSQHHN